MGTAGSPQRAANGGGNWRAKRSRNAAIARTPYRRSRPRNIFRIAVYRSGHPWPQRLPEANPRQDPLRNA
eukprot:10328193-Lingulodinium_polyedra.AAC.1